MVHFRNISGNRQAFAEVGVDEGVVDMLKAMQVYKEVGYDGIICPDHAVQAPNDPGGAQYFAYVYGYIRALIQAVDQLA
jgi:mannonate dehydratase